VVLSLKYQYLIYYTSYKNAPQQGKGLDGEFVYAWDGKDLVLLPTVSEDYRSSTKFTNLQSGKVGTKDLIEGCVYKDKNM
jgi:hypothetical protein